VSRRVLSFASLSVLAVLALTAGFGAGPTTAPPEEDDSPPVNTSTPWIEPRTKAVFHFSATENLWLSPVRMPFGKNGSGVTGALGMMNSGLACDTTTSSADAFWSSESLLYLGADYASAAFTGSPSNCTTQVYAVYSTNGAQSVGLVRQFAQAADMGSDTAHVFIGAVTDTVTGTEWVGVTCYLKPKAAGASNPAGPQVVPRVFHFRRPS